MRVLQLKTQPVWRGWSSAVEKSTMIWLKKENDKSWRQKLLSSDSNRSQNPSSAIGAEKQQRGLFIDFSSSLPFRSLHFHSTWSEQKLRCTPRPSWCGVRRSTKTWATMITFGRGSSQCWPTGSLSGKSSDHVTSATSSHRWHGIGVPL